MQSTGHRAHGLLGARAACSQRRCGCARRGIEQSRDGAPALAYIAKLYRIESELSEYREQDPVRFATERRARVEPVLDKMHGVAAAEAGSGAARLGTRQGDRVCFGTVAEADLLSRSPAAYAGQYSCEQAIRPFVIGRKNWLFSGSLRGAATSALL